MFPGPTRPSYPRRRDSNGQLYQVPDRNQTREYPSAPYIERERIAQQGYEMVRHYDYIAYARKILEAIDQYSAPIRAV